ncbi:TonB-dependent receptor plug domain-containing protein [Flavobacterium sp.]
MNFNKSFLLSILFVCQCICAQSNAIIQLDTVVISDTQLAKFSNSQSVLVLNDSIINKNNASLTSLLNYNSVIYFKENGLGMVSSPSFRGTTAQQTAVIWNGININSQFNGQTDFNTLSTRDFNSISVRAGGGSALYGSSAIGGSIHLNNYLSFKNKFENELQLTYGSFNTLNANYKTIISSRKFSTQISISRNSSSNDYPYLDTNKKNENGQFYNTSLSLSSGYKVNEHHTVTVYSYLFESERHFSGTLAAPSKSKYDDLNTRNLIEWKASYNKVTGTAKAAFFTEKFKYYENAATTIFSSAQAKTGLVKYDFEYKPSSKVVLNTIVDFTQTKGDGDDIGSNTRQIASGVVVVKQQLFDKFLYEISARKEITNNYKSPFLYSIGTTFMASNFYTLKINGSKNFRIPTFNDLFWQGSGNTNLKPESSLQIEMGNAFKFKHFDFSITGYYIKIKDLLRWSPGANGLWTPNNVADVATYGAEFIGHAAKNFGKHQLDFSATYAYTVSKDEQKNKQLMYVPYHKLTASLAYSMDRFSAHYHYLYNGKVFTSTDNFYELKDYLVSNVGVAYNFGKKKTFQLAADAFNIFNEKYQSVSTRPMPGSNYSVTINFKF